MVQPGCSSQSRVLMEWRNWSNKSSVGTKDLMATITKLKIALLELIFSDQLVTAMPMPFTTRIPRHSLQLFTQVSLKAKSLNKSMLTNESIDMNYDRAFGAGDSSTVRHLGQPNHPHLQWTGARRIRLGCRTHSSSVRRPLMICSTPNIESRIEIFLGTELARRSSTALQWKE